MTLTEFLHKDGCMAGSLKSLQFTADVVKIVNCNFEKKKIPEGDYWIEKISRMGDDKNPYFKLELRRVVTGGHHTAAALDKDLQEVYMTAEDFDKIPVEVSI